MTRRGLVVTSSSLLLLLMLLQLWSPAMADDSDNNNKDWSTLQAEQLLSLELRQCVDRKKLDETFSPPGLFWLPRLASRQWCLRAFTSRNETDLHEMRRLSGQKTGAVSSWVEFTWFRLDADDGLKPAEQCHEESSTEDSPSALASASASAADQFGWPTRNRNNCRQAVCSVAMEGFRGEYRLSPDFGGYPRCGRILERYLYDIHNLIGRDKAPPTGVNRQRYYVGQTAGGCPLLRLPYNWHDYHACKFERHHWYQLNFRSYSVWELANNTLLESLRRNVSRVLYTADEGERLYISRNQANGCLLKTVVLLARKLPFNLRIELSITVRNDSNVRDAYASDQQIVSAGMFGKEFTYLLPDGSQQARYCHRTLLDVAGRRSLPLMDERSCVYLNFSHCPPFQQSLRSNAVASVGLSLRFRRPSSVLWRLSSSLFSSFLPFLLLPAISNTLL